MSSPYTLPKEVTHWKAFAEALGRLWAFSSIKREKLPLESTFLLQVQACEIAWNFLGEGGEGGRRSLGLSNFLKQWSSEIPPRFPLPPFEASSYLMALDILGKSTALGLLRVANGESVAFERVSNGPPWTSISLNGKYSVSLSWLTENRNAARFERVIDRAQGELNQLHDPCEGVIDKSQLHRKWAENYCQDWKYDDVPYAILKCLSVRSPLPQKEMTVAISKKAGESITLDKLGEFVRDMQTLNLIKRLDGYSMTDRGRSQLEDWRKIHWPGG